MSGIEYRLFFRDGRGIRAWHEFRAEDDAEAIVMATVLGEACVNDSAGSSSGSARESSSPQRAAGARGVNRLTRGDHVEAAGTHPRLRRNLLRSRRQLARSRKLLAAAEVLRKRCAVSE